MIHLGERATLAEVLHKILSSYGTVISGNTLHEPCVKWSTRLEDLCYMAAEKGIVSSNSVPPTLGDRFWAGLTNSQIKNTLCHRKDAPNFEEMVIETHTLEEEIT